jgi:hypothetical protein
MAIGPEEDLSVVIREMYGRSGVFSVIPLWERTLTASGFPPSRWWYVYIPITVY